MTEFLNKEENEKEALIVNIQTAESGKGDPFEKLYAHYQTKYSGFWITPSNSKFKSPAGVITIPKLGDLRKKIFVINKQPELLTFNSWGGQADCGFSCDLRGATDHLDSAPGDPDPNIWYKTTFDLLPPSIMAPNSNRLLFEYLNTLSSKTPLGIISSDFPGEGLIYRIIKTNFNFKKRIDYSIRIDCGGRAYGESQNDVTVNFYNGTELLDSVIKKPQFCYIFNDTEFNITAVVPARDQELTYVNKYGEVKVISVPITHITIEIDGEDDVFIDQIRLSEKKFVPNILYPENGSDDLATDEVVFSWGVSGGSGWCLSDNVGPYDCSGLECAFGIGRGFPSCTDCASAWRFEVGCSIYYATNIGGEMDSFMGNQITSNKDLDIWEQTYSFDCIPPPAPVAVCQDFTLELNEDGKGALYPTNIDGGSYTDDYPDLSLSYQISREDFTCNDVGIHEITLTVENSGGTDTCLATVTVVDNIPPQVLTKPITVYLDENGSVSITPSQIDNGSNDACGIGSLSVNPNVFNCGDIGENTVTLTVTDNNNNTATNTAIVTVLDDILPVLTVITDPITLWPPNHKYQTIDVSELVVSVTDNCAQLTADDVYITRITSDEPENSGGNSDGNTMDDIVIDSDCHSVDLRKERRGNGNGRVYTIYLEVEDGNGNYDRATIKVHIPHNNNGVSVDDGMVYEETCSTGRSSNNGFKLSLDSVKDNNSSLRIYPNPSKSYFTIKLESMKSSDNMQIQIYDINGRGVYYSQGQTNQEYHVNVALQAGLYFVYVTHGNESQVVKLVRY